MQAGVCWAVGARSTVLGSAHPAAPSAAWAEADLGSLALASGGEPARHRASLADNV